MTQNVSMIDRVRALLVLAATLATAAFNWMASAGYVNGITPSEIFNRYPTVVTPADYAFTIWGLVHLGLIAFSIYQLLPRNIERFAAVRSPYIFSCALNCAWIFFWHGDQIVICLAISAALVVVLVLVNAKVRQTDSALESLLVKAPFGLYLGWTAVVAVVNFAVFLVYSNIDPGDPAFIIGASLLLLATAFAVLVRVKLANYFVPLAVAWALTGIAVRQSGKTLIVVAAAIGVIACLIASLSFVLDLKGSSNE